MKQPTSAVKPISGGGCKLDTHRNEIPIPLEISGDAHTTQELLPPLGQCDGKRMDGVERNPECISYWLPQLPRHLPRGAGQRMSWAVIPL